RVDPQRRTALVSVAAAIALIALKLGAGLASHSLGLISEALHSGTDLVAALLTFFAVGVAVRPADVAHQYGHGKAEHLSALAEAAFVAVLVLLAAARLMKRNVDVLMDRAPADAQEAARAAIAGIDPPVTLQRLRMRQAGPRQFMDVVITVPPGAAVGQGHAAADRVEDALNSALPGSDVVVHVEPQEDEAAIRDRAHAAALGVPSVREVHNVSVLDVGGRTEVSLHLKLPGELTLEEAHEVANQVESAIAAAVPEVDSVQTHIEPLSEEVEGRRMDDDRAERDVVLRIV